MAKLQGLLERFGLISVIGVFHKTDLHTIQVRYINTFILSEAAKAC